MQRFVLPFVLFLCGITSCNGFQSPLMPKPTRPAPPAAKLEAIPVPAPVRVAPSQAAPSVPSYAPLALSMAVIYLAAAETVDSLALPAVYSDIADAMLPDSPLEALGWVSAEAAVRTMKKDGYASELADILKWLQFSALSAENLPESVVYGSIVAVSSQLTFRLIFQQKMTPQEYWTTAFRGGVFFGVYDAVQEFVCSFV